jgi:hypothetical protein
VLTMQAVVAFALREAYVVSNRALTVDCPDDMFNLTRACGVVQRRSISSSSRCSSRADEVSQL